MSGVIVASERAIENGVSRRSQDGSVTSPSGLAPEEMPSIRPPVSHLNGGSSGDGLAVETAEWIG